MNEAIQLRDQEKFDEAIAYLKCLQVDHPRNPDVEYQIGWTYDAIDNCAKAIPHYQNSLKLGIENDRVGCFVALGSSLRSVGEYNSSKEILEAGLIEFPDYRPLKVFLAMTLYNLNECKKAVTDLLLELSETSSDVNIQSYKRAFVGYSEDLDAKF